MLEIRGLTSIVGGALLAALATTERDRGRQAAGAAAQLSPCPAPASTTRTPWTRSTSRRATGSYATNLGTPAFAPDGSLIAFNPMTSTMLENPRQKRPSS